MITPVILSGGNGTRLWPLSRASNPKQFLPLINNNYTLFQQTVLRVSKAKHKLFTDPIIICNNEHRFLVAEQLRAIDITPLNIVLETESKNTAAAITIACLMQQNPEQLLLILPADHNINNLELFYQTIANVTNLNIINNYITTFGITPSYATNKYGYIKIGNSLDNHNLLYLALNYIEKPNFNTAQKLIATKQYYWNSGMFLFTANTMLQELKIFTPKLLTSCQYALNTANYDLDFLRLDSSLIIANPKDSIDYAVMEHTKKAAIMPIDLSWSDLGSWDTLWDIASKDKNNNMLIGDTITEDTTNSYIRSENQLIATIGLDNIIVVATKDAILIADKNKINQIANIINQLKTNNRKELKLHQQVYRPWGYYQTIDLKNRFQVKRIVINPKAKTSTQIHYHRAEHWVIVEGTALIIKDEEQLLLHENESVYIPVGTKHRIENPGKIPLHLIEVQSGSYLGEDDIVRLEDAYGRHDI